MDGIVPPPPGGPPLPGSTPVGPQPMPGDASTPGQDDTSAQPETTRRDADILDRLRGRMRKKRDAFIRVYDTIEKYSYGQDYDTILYQNDPSTMTDGAFRAKINRVTEYTEIMGTYLMPQVPDASVSSMPWSTYWSKKRHQIEEQYLDYAMRAGDSHMHFRREVTEALMSGRGGMRTGFNPAKAIIQNVYKSIRDILQDPDAKCTEDVNVVAYKYTKPRWELKELIRAVRGDQAMDEAIDQAGVIGDDAAKDDTKNDPGETCDYYEFYLKVGLWRYGDTLLGTSTAGDTATQDDSPRKYYWIPGQILAITEWELPLYLIDEWPVSLVDLRPRPNHLWPTSPIEPGLTHLQSLNFMYTFYMNRIRFAWRTFLIALDYNGAGVEDDQLMKLIHSGDFSFLRVKVNGNEHDFSKLVQQFKFDSGIAEFESSWALATSEWEKSTGLSQILYDGNSGKQSRTKADVDFKAKVSQTRVDDMRKLFIGHMSAIMKKTIFAARFLHTGDDIATLLGPDAGRIWGKLAPPEQVQQETQSRMQQKLQLVQQAQQQMQQYQAALAQYRASLGQQPPGMPPSPPPQPPHIPTDDELEQQLGPPQFVSMTDWIHEADRTIDAGSVTPMDHDAKVDALMGLMTQVFPTIAGQPWFPQLVAQAIQEYAKLHQLSAEFQALTDKIAGQSLTAPPPSPAPGVPPQGLPGAGAGQPRLPGAPSPSGMRPSPPANRNPNGRPPGAPV